MATVGGSSGPGPIHQFISDLSLVQSVKEFVSKGVEKYSEIKELTPEKKGLTPEGKLQGSENYKRDSDAYNMVIMLAHGVADPKKTEGVKDTHSENKAKDLEVLKQNVKNLKVLEKFFSMSEEEQLSFLQKNHMCTGLNVKEYKNSSEYRNMQQTLKQYQSDQVRLAGAEFMKGPSLSGLQKLGGALKDAPINASSMHASKAIHGIKVTTRDTFNKVKNELQDLRERVGTAVDRSSIYPEIEEYTGTSSGTESEFQSLDEAETTADRSSVYIDDKKAIYSEGYKKCATSEEREGYKAYLKLMKTDKRSPEINKKAAEIVLQEIENREHELQEIENKEREEVIKEFKEMGFEDRKTVIALRVHGLEIAGKEGLEGHQKMLNDLKEIMIEDFNKATGNDKKRMRDEIINQIAEPASKELRDWYTKLLIDITPKQQKTKT